MWSDISKSIDLFQCKKKKFCQSFSLSLQSTHFIFLLYPIAINLSDRKWNETRRLINDTHFVFHSVLLNYSFGFSEIALDLLIYSPPPPSLDSHQVLQKSVSLQAEVNH